MKSVETWLAEYETSHQHPANKLIHWICVPVIIFSLTGMLWVIPFPDIILSLFVLNWATIILFFVLGYYFYLCWRLAIGMSIFGLIIYVLLLWLESAGINIGKLSATLFILSWIGQFMGHLIEKRRPLFFKDIQFLLIGPLYLLGDLYRKLKISYD